MRTAKKLKPVLDKASVRVRMVESQITDCVNVPRDCLFEQYNQSLLPGGDLGHAECVGLSAARYPAAINTQRATCASTD